MIPKKSRIQFVSEAKKIIEENGFTPTEKQPKQSSPEWDRTTYEKQTDKNRLEVILYGQDRQQMVFSVFGLLEIPSEKIGNCYSGKANFHCVAPVLEAIADFEDYIKELVETEL